MWEMVLRLMGWARPAMPTAVETPRVESVPAAEDTAGPFTPSLFEVAGSNNLQVGYAGGNVVSRVSHHQHTHTHVTVIHTPQAPANEPQVRKPSSAEQSATLRRLDQVRDRIAILEFMERRFDTRMVINLKSEQLNLLNMYLDTVMEDPRNLKTREQVVRRNATKHINC